MDNGSLETAELSDTRIKVVPFVETSLFKSPYTRVVLNSDYKDQIPNITTIQDYILLPSAVSGNEVPFDNRGLLYPRIRESGDSSKEMILAEKDGYKRVGRISTKAAGAKSYSPYIVGYSEIEGKSYGVSGPEEMMVDMNMSDIVSNTEGSNISTPLGFITVDRRDFLIHLKEQGFNQYAEFLEKSGYSSQENEHIPSVFLIRFTDPARIPTITTQDRFNSDTTMRFKEVFKDSEDIFRREVELNGRDAFVKRYSLPSDLVPGKEYNPQKTLLILTHMMANNVVAHYKNRLRYAFDLKDVGIAGKLSDFAPVLNNMGVLSQSDASDYAMISVEDIIRDISCLTDFFDSRKTKEIIESAMMNAGIKCNIKYEFGSRDGKQYVNKVSVN